MRFLPQASPKKHTRTAKLLLLFLACCVVVLIPLLYRWTQTHILPGIYIDGVNVGERTRDEAILLLQKHGRYSIPSYITLEYQGKTHTLSTQDIHMTQNPEKAIDEAVFYGKTGSWKTRLTNIAYLILQDKHIHIPRTIQEDALATWIQGLAKLIDRPGKKPSIALRVSGSPQSLQVFIGTEGKTVQQERLKNAILSLIQNTAKASFDTILIPVEEMIELTPTQVDQLKKRAIPIVGKKLTFRADDVELTLNDQSIIATFLVPQGVSKKEIERVVLDWVAVVDRAIQEPHIKVLGKIVTEFTPPRSGRSLDAASSKELVLQSVREFDTSHIVPQEPISLPVMLIEPKKKLAEMNSLGINERIGYALSTFFHSIPGRVHNVGLVGQRIHLEVVPPGGIFSYNKAVGEVSRATGFQPAYIIQQGRTVLGDGGGVCQGSTTVFRAALNAGLPIVERKGHSYRVGYYEQNSLPGIDATSFSPSPDLKFSNDTPGYILVTASVDPKRYSMIVELWGTSDGRVATIRDHKVFGQTPPKPTIYQDDPTLPVGVLKQVDWSAPGAKTSFYYVVKRGRETLQDRVFTTVYQPWAAVYLRGTRQ